MKFPRRRGLKMKENGVLLLLGFSLFARRRCAVATKKRATVVPTLRLFFSTYFFTSAARRNREQMHSFQVSCDKKYRRKVREAAGAKAFVDLSRSRRQKRAKEKNFLFPLSLPLPHSPTFPPLPTSLPFRLPSPSYFPPRPTSLLPLPPPPSSPSPSTSETPR